MINDKSKIRIRRYSCWYCNNTGFFSSKQTIFKLWNWGYEFVNRKICKYCDGRGFVVFRHKFEKTNAYQSFLEHQHEQIQNTLLYGTFHTPMHLLLFIGGSMILSKIFFSISQESFLNHNYCNDMNNIKFEHRSGALPFIPFFLSVCAPVLCSKIIQTKKEMYDR